MFTQTILRKPCPEFVDGITTANLGSPNFEKALIQHEAYRKVLAACGVETLVLEADSRFPDSCFIEDIALCTPKCAIITNPGEPSRRRETEGIEAVLSPFFENIERINAPGTVEAGDIMMVQDHFYIGLSKRTNLEGANQLIAILNKYGMTGSLVELKKVLHLKTGVSYLENDFLLATGEFIEKPEFLSYDIIEAPDNEAYAANSIWVNDTILVPDGFPQTRENIEKAGLHTMAVPASEFQKLDGGLSCLSLRF